jgi:hypothetical protein
VVGGVRPLGKGEGGARHKKEKKKKKKKDRVKKKLILSSLRGEIKKGHAPAAFLFFSYFNSFCGPLGN